MPVDRFERRLQDSLADLASEQVPPYVTDLLARTARQRQRPTWTFPERWLPMTIALRRPGAVPHLRLLTTGLVLLLTAIVAIPSLTRLSLLPAAVSSLPLNGLIAFPPDDGHIHWFDPSTGRRSLWLLTGGGSGDGAPARLTWSPDGTRLAFAEIQASGATEIHIACAPGLDACGTPPTRTSGEMRVLRWAPDATRLLVVSEEAGRWVVDVVPADVADGATTERIDLGMSLDWATWHPDGTSILVKGTTDDGVPRLYHVPLGADRNPQAILEVDTSTPLFARWTGSEYLWDPAYAPDGSTIMYSTVVDLLPRQASNLQNARARMVDADGTNDRLFEISADSDYETAGGWSPDGTRVVVNVQHAGGNMLAIAPADDPTTAVLIGPGPAVGTGVIWSPDGDTLLSWGADGATALIDAATGDITPVDIPIWSDAAWQPAWP